MSARGGSREVSKAHQDRVSDNWKKKSADVLTGYDSSYDSGYQAVTSQKEWKITAAGTNYDTRPASDVASQSLPDILQGSDKVFTQTGVGAKLITSFTVTDLETIVTPTGDATLQAAIIEQVYTETVSVREATATTATTSPTSSPLPSWATSASPPPGTFTITGINAQVISSTTVGLEAMAAATKAAGIQLWPSDTIASPYPANDNHAQSEYAAAPFASPSQDPNAGRAQAEKSESQVAEIPGHKLSVLPIGATKHTQAEYSIC